MSTDKIAIKLNGVVPIEEFAKAIGHFSNLVMALTSEIANKDEIAWSISNLGYGSALAEVQGVATEEEKVHRVTNAFWIVGEALRRNDTIPFSLPVVEEACSLASIINGHVTSIEFIVSDKTATVATPIPPIPAPTKYYSLGTVTGRIDTLSRRKHMFVLYDELFDRPVSCYLESDNDEVMRGAWGKLTTVVGEIERDPESGQALAVRKVKNVIVEEDIPLGSFEAARGILRQFSTPLPSEKRIEELFYG